MPSPATMGQVVTTAVQEDLSVEVGLVFVFQLDQIASKIVVTDEFRHKTDVRWGAGRDHRVSPGQQEKVQTIFATTKNDVSPARTRRFDLPDIANQRRAQAGNECTGARNWRLAGPWKNGPDTLNFRVDEVAWRAIEAIRGLPEGLRQGIQHKTPFSHDQFKWRMPLSPIGLVQRCKMRSIEDACGIFCSI